jgi:hypothetical protein
MLAAEQFHSWDRRENRAIDVLCPMLGEALATGRAAVVRPFATSLTHAQLVALAVRLCEGSDSNVAVVGSHDGRTLAFVPLGATTRSFLRTQLGAEARRGRARFSVAWSAAGPAQPRGSVTI